MKKLAFTLSELLITIAVIGVIAVLTLPNVTQSFKEKANITRLKTTYSTFDSAINSVLTNNGVNYLEDTIFTFDSLNDFFSKYMKLAKVGNAVTDCFASSYKFISSSTTFSVPSGLKYYTLQNGVSVAIQFHALDDNDSDDDGTDDLPAYQHAYTAYLDVNGLEEPNTVGRDLFAFDFDSDGSIDFSFANQNISLDTFKNGCTKNTSVQDNSSTLPAPNCCMAYLVQNKWNMDY